MPVLGKALANYLRNIRGLYSVELPSRLRNEILDFVLVCNEKEAKRAVFVTDEDLSDTGVDTIPWSELLRWRTDDNRIFIWERGNREPDTSFQSVVKQFISSKFPGVPEGECSLHMLARLSIEELWRSKGLSLVGDVFEAFLETATWVAGVSHHAFEQVGSIPSAHWSDEFLVHWSYVLTLLEASLATLPKTELLARHAWEIVRVAGFPVPLEISGTGNPYMESPKAIQESGWAKVAKRWQDTVDEYLLTEDNRAILLTALDLIVKGAENTGYWRDLNWNALQSLSAQDSVAAPTVGQKVFASSPSPSIVSVQIPTYPASQKPSWWGVTEVDIQKALDSLQKTTFFKPDVACQAFEEVSNQPDTYWVKSRLGTVSHTPTSKVWKAEVVLQDLTMLFKAPWTKLVISYEPPKDAGSGLAWIRPEEDISLEVTGRDVKAVIKELSVLSGTQLAIRFNLIISYTAKRDEKANTISGNWNPLRSLQVNAKVKDWRNGQWENAPRNVDSSVKLLISSPFSQTVLVTPISKGKPSIVPSTGDVFTVSKDVAWSAQTTPDLILKEEGQYEVNIYDGRLNPDNPSFIDQSKIYINGIPLLVSTEGASIFSQQRSLDDGDVVSGDEAAGGREIAVIKVKERSASLSSGLMSAIKGLPAGQKAPSSQTVSTFPGQYQVHVAQALCNPPPGNYNSLYQYVVSTGEELRSWPRHSGQPAPEYLFSTNEGFTLPGIGNGPSPDLVGCPEWTTFMQALKEVCQAIGLVPGIEKIWLSGFDPSTIPATVVRTYVETHRNLVRAAKKINPADAFWSSYPFSVAIVEGTPDASYGQLLAVLLSPLHPARLAWAYAVAFVARSSGGSGKHANILVGFAEGWNIPYTGCAVNIAGQLVPLVAVPTDPGTEQDFASWSALAVLDHTGLARLPAIAAGLPLPWGGQTGINKKVITRAIKDYLAVHPHLNSLNVDVRSVSPAPRSREIDDAVLQLLGGTDSLEEIERLGGSIRVQDSANRLGPIPTRDQLSLLREESEISRPFEWSRYKPGLVPASADLAFIENSSVHLSIGQGRTNGLIGYLPLRRFCPTSLNNLVLQQNYTALQGEDLLGLTGLLGEIEYNYDGSPAALQAIPQAHSLGVGMGSRWEILGTFNIDPQLLSLVVSKQAQLYGKRLVWEWRPSWLRQGESDLDISKRPYYVVGKVPASLLKALDHKQGLTESQAFDMLVELGKHGIGLTSLHAAGGSQESAAAGFFYALRLLLSFPHQSSTALEAVGRESTFSVVPLDPIETILEALAGEKLERRADLLALRISKSDSTRICLVPVEIKHHGQEANPEPLPSETDKELRRAREQLDQTARTLERIAEKIGSEGEIVKNLPLYHLRLLGIATLLELSMTLAPSAPTPEIQSAILRDVLQGRIEIGIEDPILLWFSPGSINISGQAITVKTTTFGTRTLQEVYIDPAAAKGLWWQNQNSGANEEQVRQQFNKVMEDALTKCTPTKNTLKYAQGIGLAELLGLDELIGLREAKNEESAPKQSDEQKVEKASVDVISEQPAVKQERVEETKGKIDSEKTLPRSKEEEQPHEDHRLEIPKAFLGWNQVTTRWSIIGSLPATGEKVALDLDNPKAVGIFGYMGSGKSYLLSTLVESALEAIHHVNVLSVPLAVVIFNYRRNASDRFELSSLALPNQNPQDIERLALDYGAVPQSMSDIHILCLPGELTDNRVQEYYQLPASELFFNPDTLTIEDWELLMGEPGSSAVFARTIRHILRELRSSGKITLERLSHHVMTMLKGQSRAAAQLRLEFVRQYISEERGVDFNKLIKPGRTIILDLRQPLFNKNDALRFFLISSNYVSRVQGQFNKLVVFDEAHEYMSEEFGERIDARIRLMRHEGTSYVFATQDVGSIPASIRRFLTTRFVFSLGTRENIDDLIKFAPEFEGHDLQHMEPGYCLVQGNESIRGFFTHPRIVKIRPRVTNHGGASRIFTSQDQ